MSTRSCASATTRMCRETIWAPIPTPCSRADAEAYVDRFKRGGQGENDSGPALIVADAGTDEMIGIVFLRMREHESVELSYGVAAARRNAGVATAAVSLVARWCLDELDADRVELRVGQPTSPRGVSPRKPGSAMRGVCAVTSPRPARTTTTSFSPFIEHPRFACFTLAD